MRALLGVLLVMLLFGVAHAEYRLDVQAVCGATGNGITDDGPAIASCQAMAAGNYTVNNPTTLYFPPGVYNVCSPLQTQVWPISLIGEGHLKSIISVCPSYAGPLFSWSEVWYENNMPFGGNSLVLTNLKAGVIVKGLSIVGQRAAVAEQDAFVFYDRADAVYFNDVEVYYLNGRALFAGGALKNTTVSFIRESHFENMRFFNCGKTGSPVMEIGALGGGDSSNEIDINNLDIYAPYDIGLVFRGNHSGQVVDDVKVSRLRIEGLQNGATAADLLQIGDDVFPGIVDNIYFKQAELIDPYTGHNAIRLTASSPASQPYQIQFSGAIGGGLPNGNGININAGRSSSFEIIAMYTFGTNIIVAPVAKVGGQITVNAFGAEGSWTRAIDPSSAAHVTKPTPEQF